MTTTGSARPGVYYTFRWMKSLRCCFLAIAQPNTLRCAQPIDDVLARLCKRICAALHASYQLALDWSNGYRLVVPAPAYRVAVGNYDGERGCHTPSYECPMRKHDHALNRQSTKCAVANKDLIRKQRLFPLLRSNTELCIITSGGYLQKFALHVYNHLRRANLHSDV